VRETREVRKRLFGDVKKAATYIGLARTLLGQVKQQAAFGSLSQLSRFITLPDGTQITVDTRFGQDMIEIRSPVRPGVGREEVTVPRPSFDVPPLEVPPGFVLAGYRRLEGVPYTPYRAAMWRGTNPITLLPQPTIHTSDVYSFGVDVSGDGSVIIVQANDYHPSSSHPSVYYLWSAAQGLYAPPDAAGIGDSHALVSLSRQGRHLAGMAGEEYLDEFSLIRIRYYTTVWDALRGWRRLPFTPGISAYPVRMAADGAAVVGQIRMDSADNPSETAAAVWFGDDPPIIISEGTEGYHWAQGVSAGGELVCGTRWDISGGSDNYYPFMWTRQGGAVALPGGSGVALAVSADGGIIVGALCATVNSVNYSPPTVAVSNATPVFWRGDGTGPFALPAPSGGAITSVSADGALLAGMVADPGGAPVRAAVWNRTQLIHVYADTPDSSTVGNFTYPATFVVAGIGVPEGAQVPGVHVEL